MTKIYQGIIILFLVAILALICLYNYADRKATKLETENKEISASLKGYKSQLEKEHNDKLELDKQYKKLQEKAKMDKNFDWYADISGSPVVLELHD